MIVWEVQCACWWKAWSLDQVAQHTSLDLAQQPIRFWLSKLGLPLRDHCRRRLLSPNQLSLASTPNLPYSQLVLAKLSQSRLVLVFLCHLACHQIWLKRERSSDSPFSARFPIEKWNVSSLSSSSLYTFVCRRQTKDDTWDVCTCGPVFFGCKARRSWTREERNQRLSLFPLLEFLVGTVICGYSDTFLTGFNCSRT